MTSDVYYIFKKTHKNVQFISSNSCFVSYVLFYFVEYTKPNHQLGSRGAPMPTAQWSLPAGINNHPTAANIINKASNTDS